MSNSKVPDNPKQHIHNLNFKNECTDCGEQFVFVYPDSSLGEEDLRNKLEDLAVNHYDYFVDYREEVDGIIQLFTSGADKRVNEALEAVQDEIVLHYYDTTVGRKLEDFIIEKLKPGAIVERQRLNKEGE